MVMCKNALHMRIPEVIRMRNRLFTILLALGFSVFTLNGYGSKPANIRISRITIVSADISEPDNTVENWRYSYAAEELAAYLKKMSGQDVSIRRSSKKVNTPAMILIGGPERNSLTKKLVRNKAVSLEIPACGGDGFVTESVMSDGKNYLILAGENGVSTLYSAYDYLTRYCDVGFFADGEYVPKRNAIPLAGVKFQGNPFFHDRMVYYGISDSYERFYQSLRRCYRRGQLEKVQAYIPITLLEKPIMDNLNLKSDKWEKMIEDQEQRYNKAI